MGRGMGFVRLGARSPTRRAALLVLLAALLVALGAPSAASAYRVTVKIHGAGKVEEVANRFGESKNQGSCTVSPDGTSESSETSCVLGTAAGLWNSGNIVRLAPSVPTESFNRGWRYLKWVDGTGSGQINCDPQDTTGDQTTPSYCEFQIFQDLHVDLYFDDVEGPGDTDITSGPVALTKQTSATFNFDAPSDPSSTFQCRLDRPSGNGVYAACGGPSDKSESYSGLTENGAYTLRVKGVDPSGNEDFAPDTWTWTVDTLPPTPSITGGPPEGSFDNHRTAEFTIGATEGASLTCNVSPNIVTNPCSSGTYTSSMLSEGPHTFTLTAKDAAGNEATTTRSWTVDTVAPKPTLEGGPAQGSSVASTSAAFEVGANEGTLACNLDGAAEPCTAGTVQAYDSLGQGGHTFTLTATDVAGNVGTVTRTWTVDTVAPALTLDGGPAQGSVTTEAGASFAIGTSEGTLSCSLDGVAQACAPPSRSFSGLAPGPHAFAISATDTAGNQSSLSRSWTIVLPAPIAPPGDGTASDRTAPNLALFGPRRQKAGRSISVGVACPEEACLVTGTGIVLAGKTFKLGPAVARIPKGGQATLALKLDAKSRKSIKRRLRQGKKATAQVAVTAEDAAGNSAVAKRTIELKR
jgi:hypothetical protein